MRLHVKLILTFILFASFYPGISSAQENHEVTVIINGVKQIYSQPAVTVNGRTLVPLRGIFEELGAEIEWNSSSQIARATKGNTVVLVQVDNKSAYVDGEEFVLSVPPQIINKSTMVPLRFVSVALGADIKWDNITRTATITSKSEPLPTKLEEEHIDAKEEVKYGSDYWGYGHQIEVRYGDHDYGVENQEQYNEVMEIVDNTLKKLVDVVISERYAPYLIRYIDGDRKENYSDPKSEDYRWLKAVQSDVGDLVEAGVSKEKILEVIKIKTMALDLLRKAPSITGDGSPRSIYDALVRLDDDCDSTAQTYSAFFDSMGYNTLIRAGNGHADAYIQIDENWYRVIGWDKVSINPNQLSFGPGPNGRSYLMSNPTFN